MPIPDADMARYREIAQSLNLPPASIDAVIHVIVRICLNHIDRAFGEDSTQLSMWEKRKNCVRTQREHARLPRIASKDAEGGAAGSPGEEG